MHSHPSPLGRMGDDGPSSPKRKKMRQKYAPKACVSCRRSKLKCTGENPCQRCTDNNKRCFYSEDQTAAEVLQNLSRPGPHAQPTASNGGLSSRRTALPRHDTSSERRASDESALGMTMEARMARIEVMMEALIQDRGLTMTSRGNVEREDVGSDVIRSDTAFSMPVLDPIHPALDQIQHLSPELPTQPQIRFGDQALPFPVQEQYQYYMTRFFGDIHVRYPCLSEPHFKSRIEGLLVSGIAQKNDACFLALVYIIFACCDILSDSHSTMSNDRRLRPGWNWFKLSDSLIDKRFLLTGCADLVFVEFLLFQAVYLAHCDLPGLAYNAIKLACTATVQQNLHNLQMHSNLQPEESYWQICLFWSVYYTDGSISASCDRPRYHFPTHAMIESAGMYYEESIVPFQQHTEDLKPVINQYQLFMMYRSRAMGKMTEQVEGPQIATTSAADQSGLIQEFLSETKTLHVLALEAPEAMHLYYESFRHLHSATVLLVPGRKMIQNQDFDFAHCELFRSLALHIVKHLNILHGARLKGFGLLHQMISAAAISLLVLGSLLIRPLLPVPRYEVDMDAFKESLAFLSAWATKSPYARRVHNDCQSFSSILVDLIDRYNQLPYDSRGFESWQSLVSPLSNDMSKAIPYQASSASLQVALDASQGWENVENDTGGTGDGVLWLL